MNSRMVMVVAAAGLMTGSQAFAQPMRVRSAVYGTPEASRTCNATPAVAVICNGQAACSVPVGNQLCGDPNFLVVKRIDVTYQCGRRAWRIGSSEYTVLPVYCP